VSPCGEGKTKYPGRSRIKNINLHCTMWNTMTYPLLVRLVYGGPKVDMANIQKWRFSYEPVMEMKAFIVFIDTHIHDISIASFKKKNSPVNFLSITI
jgi:hypothetical protein